MNTNGETEARPSPNINISTQRCAEVNHHVFIGRRAKQRYLPQVSSISLSPTTRRSSPLSSHFVHLPFVLLFILIFVHLSSQPLVHPTIAQSTCPSDDNLDVCLSCPANSACTLDTDGVASCVCTLGYVAQNLTDQSSATGSNFTCLPCPAHGAECTSTPGVAKAKPNWWYDEYSQQFYECPPNYCCDKRSDEAGCELDDPARCYPHRYGFLCSSCEDGYSSISGQPCVECTGPNVVVLSLLCVAGFLFILLCLAENPSEDASTKLIVDYVQMCVLILNPTIGINDILQLVHLQFSDTTSWFHVCVAPMPEIVALSAPALAPLALFVALGFIHLLHWMVAHWFVALCCKGHSERWVRWYEKNRWRYTNAAWEITLFGFMAIVSACVQIMDCRAIGSIEVVHLAPSIECFTGIHLPIACVALSLFSVLTLVIPIWLVGMLSELSKSTKRRSSAFLHSMKQIRMLKQEYKRQRAIRDKMMKDEERSTEAGGKQSSPKAIAKLGSSPKLGPMSTDAPEDLDRKIMDLDEFLQRQLVQDQKVYRTGHEIVLWCYHTNNYWSEAAFLLRRVLFILVTVLLERDSAALLILWFCVTILVWHARRPVFRKRSSAYFHDFCLGAIAIQSALNLAVYSRDATGAVDFDSPAEQAIVLIVYIIAILPIAVGIGLFVKEMWKERIRNRHAVKKGEQQKKKDTGFDCTSHAYVHARCNRRREDGERKNHQLHPTHGGVSSASCHLFRHPYSLFVFLVMMAPCVDLCLCCAHTDESDDESIDAEAEAEAEAQEEAEEEAEEEEEATAKASAHVNGMIASPSRTAHSSPTAEPSSSSSLSGSLPRSPSYAPRLRSSSMGIELSTLVSSHGPNVSTRPFSNAPVDLDAVLKSATGGIISTPQYPNNHQPPVTIHF